MVTGTVQGQCQDPTTTVGIPSSLESGSLMQCPPESQAAGLACLHMVKPAWPAQEDVSLSAGSENISNNPGCYSFIFIQLLVGALCVE